MPCVDSLRRWDTKGPPARVAPPFRSLLSMLMANRMEFRPDECSRKGEVMSHLLHISPVNHMKTLRSTKCSGSFSDDKERKPEMNSGCLNGYEGWS